MKNLVEVKKQIRIILEKGEITVLGPSPKWEEAKSYIKKTWGEFSLSEIQAITGNNNYNPLLAKNIPILIEEVKIVEEFMFSLVLEVKAEIVFGIKTGKDNRWFDETNFIKMIARKILDRDKNRPFYIDPQVDSFLKTQSPNQVKQIAKTSLFNSESKSIAKKKLLSLCKKHMDPVLNEVQETNYSKLKRRSDTMGGNYGHH